MPYFLTVRDYLVPAEHRRGPALYAPENLEDTPPARCVPFLRPQALQQLQDRLKGFFTEPENFARLQAFLERPVAKPAKKKAPKEEPTSVSLRILDFLCTDYRSELEQVDIPSPTALYEGYQNMLRSYSKNLFDVFARGPRVSLPGPKGEVITTYGQLNFFRWAIQHGLLDRLQGSPQVLRDSVRAALRKRTAEHAESSPQPTKRARVARAFVKFGGPFSPFV